MRVPTLVLAVLALAGCLAPAAEDLQLAADPTALLSQERFELLPGESVWVEASSDGARLHARLFLPDMAAAPEWKAPTILVMSPYFGFDAREDLLDPASLPEYFRYKWLVEHFVPRGYAVAFADVRGTGDSGGCLEQTGRLQSQDGYDLVEFLGTQPWSNGKVGMFGKSYDAETQQSTATLAPPHLATIVPVSSVSGQYEYNFYDGVPFQGFPFTPQAFASNFFYMASDGLQPPTTTEGLAQYPTRAGCHPEMLAQGLDTSGDWNAFWEEREIRKGAESVTASVLYVHGLQDWNVKPVAIRDWLDRLPPATTRAILGQWAHDYPEENRWERSWSRQDWRETVHRWYDHWLLGLDNGILDELPPVQVQDTTGAWRREEAWPPADAATWTLHLAPGRLVREPPPEFDALKLRENEEAWVAANTGAPVPVADSGAYLDRLVFDSDALASNLHFAGWPVLRLNLTLVPGLAPAYPRDPDAHFAAVVYAVDPSGTAKWIERGYLSARHREGVESPQPVPLGEAVEYEIRFFPQDTVVPAGHQLRLVLAGSDEWTEPEKSLWAAHVHGGELVFPRVERDLATVGLDVPLGDPVDS